MFQKNQTMQEVRSETEMLFFKLQNLKCKCKLIIILKNKNNFLFKKEETCMNQGNEN